MKELQFSIEINAPKLHVWETLWHDASFREWAGLIDPGTYMVGELKEGGVVQFISAENGYGVSSLVEHCVPGESLLLRHSADTQGSGKASRDDQWTGGTEAYQLTEYKGVTTLTITFDVPLELVDTMNDSYPKAMERIKTLSES